MARSSGTTSTTAAPIDLPPASHSTATARAEASFAADATSSTKYGRSSAKSPTFRMKGSSTRSSNERPRSDASLPAGCSCARRPERSAEHRADTRGEHKPQRFPDQRGTAPEPQLPDRAAPRGRLGRRGRYLRRRAHYYGETAACSDSTSPRTIFGAGLHKRHRAGRLRHQRQPDGRRSPPRRRVQLVRNPTLRLSTRDRSAHPSGRGVAWNLTPFAVGRFTAYDTDFDEFRTASGSEEQDDTASGRRRASALRS